MKLCQNFSNGLMVKVFMEMASTQVYQRSSALYGFNGILGWENGHPTLDAACGYIETDSTKGKDPRGRWKSSPCEEQKNYVCGKKYNAQPDCPLGMFIETL